MVVNVFTLPEQVGDDLFRILGGRLKADSVEGKAGALTLYHPEEDGLDAVANMPSALTTSMANEMTKSLRGFRTTVGWWPDERLDGPADRPGLCERIVVLDPYDERYYALLSSEQEFLDDDFVRFYATIGGPTMLLSNTQARQISCLQAYFEPPENSGQRVFCKIMDPDLMPGEMQRDPDLTVCILSRDDDYVLPLELLIRGEHALNAIQSYINALPDLYIVAGDANIFQAADSAGRSSC